MPRVKLLVLDIPPVYRHANGRRDLLVALKGEGVAFLRGQLVWFKGNQHGSSLKQRQNHISKSASTLLKGDCRYKGATAQQCMPIRVAVPKCRFWSKHVIQWAHPQAINQTQN